MVRRLEQNLGAEAMRAATGRDHEEWRALLLDAGAVAWSHGQTAAWLAQEHGLDSWWAQGITVDFEQACKGRLPGQKSDGTFTASITRTIGRGRLEALAAVASAVSGRYGDPYNQNLAASQPVVRWRLEDGTRLSIAAGTERPTGTPVTLIWERLRSHEDVLPAKEQLAALLAHPGPAQPGRRPRRS